MFGAKCIKEIDGKICDGMIRRVKTNKKNVRTYKCKKCKEVYTVR